MLYLGSCPSTTAWLFSQPASRNQLTTITTGSSYHGSSNATLFRRVDPFLFIHFFFLPLSFSKHIDVCRLFLWPVSYRGGQPNPGGIARNADNTQDNDQLFVMVEIKEKRGSSRTKPPFDTGLFVYSGFSSLHVYAVCYRCVCGSECDEGGRG